GWNNVIVKKPTKLFENVDDFNFYFVHSYHASGCLAGDVETVCDYGYEFVSSVNKDNVWGVQFHPEKSGDTGLRLLKNFAKIN
ncbi:MAG: imidazole glycerol phosphate synthase HisHF, partial [Clostridia bacterium]|nr:imidazole glycerol phosphate synthase HisHF [Clostridia bacterium]